MEIVFVPWEEILAGPSSIQTCGYWPVKETYMTRSERNNKLDCLKGLPLIEGLNEMYVTVAVQITGTDTNTS